MSKLSLFTFSEYILGDSHWVLHTVATAVIESSGTAAEKKKKEMKASQKGRVVAFLYNFNHPFPYIWEAGLLSFSAFF